MITTVTGHDDRHRDLLDEVFRFRHKVFVEEKGWEALRRDDGRERDLFDDADTIHQICRRDGAIVGYQRLRPSLKPHLLSDPLADLCQKKLPRGPRIYEWSRFCLGSMRRESRPRANDVFLELCQAVVEWGLDRGVRTTTVAIDCRLMVIAMQLRFQARPLGFPKRIGRDNVVALELKFNRETLDTIRDARDAEAPARTARGAQTARELMPV